MLLKHLISVCDKIEQRYGSLKQRVFQNDYQKNLGKYGRNCSLSSKILIKSNLNQLFVSDDVIVEDYATLECSLENSAIYLGDRSIIRHFAILKSMQGQIKIGRDCSVNPYSALFGCGDLIIGDLVRIATHVVINPANHLFDDIDIPIDYQPLTNKGVIIEDDVWIGAGAIILEGCTIGKGSVIGAGTVVTKSVEPYSVVVGVPGRIIRKRGESKRNDIDKSLLMR
ncbi:acetyltransferase [Scytonema hofmannii PCC 7110]|uniref:Acetyltransferase n=1 Tax=Scytonema hofmannii PCC 7110 TaxID=128403 RepID=A0A139XA79_9CYAN|nr:acyltransferase [Scytonema hofmannii]KYC41576.1 acetyltransferase [Scytonema hofmannii PCC 7110]